MHQWSLSTRFCRKIADTISCPSRHDCRSAIPGLETAVYLNSNFHAREPSVPIFELGTRQQLLWAQKFQQTAIKLLDFTRIGEWWMTLAAALRRLALKAPTLPAS